jgi:hypothetical protein
LGERRLCLQIRCVEEKSELGGGGAQTLHSNPSLLPPLLAAGGNYDADPSKNSNFQLHRNGDYRAAGGTDSGCGRGARRG